MQPTKQEMGCKSQQKERSQMIGIELPLELKGRRQARIGITAREIEMREAEFRDF